MSSNNAAWGGALTAVGALTLLGGVAAHQPCPPQIGIGGPPQRFCGESALNVGTVLGAGGLAGGILLLSQGGGRSRTRGRSHTGGVSSHNRRSRYRGH